ncbi:glycine--tRNA ligase [Candidatus Nomurabacteria bacterium]|jgi:glycyl-tRNA synthetase|nr:MAG: glycine--tRNA ligase [Candidatus Nomurabacteria bacterium]
MKEEKENLMEKIVSLAKRRGFIYPGSEIYGGLAGTYDYGPLGVALKNNIKNSWWKKFVDNREDMYGVDAAILMRPEVWQASGHVDTFTDPLVECTKCKRRFRSDQLQKTGSCDVCNSPVGEARQFNMMFATQIGAVEDSSAKVYLRPETAQGIFVNFKNIVDSFHPKLPFGIAQIGKAFRNEITPRDFIFRVREFEQMEIEYFVRPSDWEKYFEYLKDEMLEWMESVGLDMSKVHELEVADGDRAHYSSRTIDFEFDYPFGKKELYGLAYRTDFDLKNHKLEYIDEEAGEKITPHVIEPSFGVDRTILALLQSAYAEDDQNEEVRAFLKFKPSIAPVICAVSPLLKNKPELVEKARIVYGNLKAEFGRVMWDDNGNIGKRYRRQDEIGTPWCIVIDFDTLIDDTVTVRDRDTGKQERIKQQELPIFLKEKLTT